MKFEAERNPFNNTTEFRGQISDRDLFAKELGHRFNPAQMADEIRFQLCCKIAESVFERLGPAIEKAVSELGGNDGQTTK